jgi:hypothetical protein
MFRGNYKPVDSLGAPLLYSKGDDILYQGKIYSCTSTTTLSPTQSPESWNVTGVSNVFTSDQPPIKPIENQTWVSTSGRQYVYYKDDNGYQWIEF